MSGIVVVCVSSALAIALSGTSWAESTDWSRLSLEQAISRAIERTGRGEMSELERFGFLASGAMLQLRDGAATGDRLSGKLPEVRRRPALL